MSDNKEIEKNIVSLIKSGQIKMKPKWYFVLGSLAMTFGLIALVLLSVFLISLISFSLRTHGPMGFIRYQQIISSFPWWAPILALVGIYFGVKIFRQYDFSYKKNFVAVVVIFISVILVSGWLINYFGFDDIWLKRGPLKGMYNKYDGGMMRGPGHRMMHDNFK